MDPVKIQNGLALYSLGEGPVVFLMPYPHASSARSTADGRFAELIIHCGFRVITFDPPSFARSTRTASSELYEMFACALECLEYFKIDNPVPFLGHSMGGFCALALSIEHPALVSGLLISGSPSGWTDVKKYSIHKKWSWWEKKFWLSRYYGLRIILNFANLKIHKQLDNLSNFECFHDKRFFEELIISPGDHKKPPPPRAVWLRKVRRYDFNSRLNEIQVPVLIASGRYDPMVPSDVSVKMKNNIPGAEIKFFEISGHSPFIEEKDKFADMMKKFLISLF